MRNKNLCSFRAVMNVVFNYLESLQQVLITKTPPAVSHMPHGPIRPANTLSPWPFLIKIRGKNVNRAPATSGD